MIVISCLAQMMVQKSWFKKHPVIWSMIRMTYLGLHGPQILHLLNKLELQYQGSFLPWLVVITIDMHTTLGGNMIEEMCHGDLGVNYKLGSISCFWDNLSSYLSYAI